MAFVKVATLSQLPPDTVIEVMVGEDPYAVCNAKGKIRAFDGICPHAGGPLGQGTIIDGAVLCPWHGYEFDCATGENLDNPMMRVQTVPVKIEGQDVLIDPQAAAEAGA